MNATINVPRILRAMATKGYTKRDACAVCHVSSRTLNKVLKGVWPRRVDAMQRITIGLGIPFGEAVIGAKMENERKLRAVKSWQEEP